MLKEIFKRKYLRGTKIHPAEKKLHKTSNLWKSYSQGLYGNRILFEFIFPIIISSILVFINIYSNLTVDEALQRIKNINVQIFTILAIQIGFNITSISLIASFNKEELLSTFSKIADYKRKVAALKQLVSSFTYCVLIQTSIIITGIIYNITVEDLYKLNILLALKNTIQVGILLPFYFIWIFFIMHSFMVFIRNVILIYKFILVKFNN